jgi:sugar O-acyltransferase (sialic acid O-acetyltransferase NeuD family)
MSVKTGTPIIIVGARFNGHAAVVESIISSSTNFTVFGYIDDNPALINQSHKNKKVLGGAELLENIYREGKVKHAIVAFGDNELREKFILQLSEIGYGIPNIIHTNAVIAEDSVLGKGCVLAPGSIIMNGCKIGDGVTINTGATIDHNCVLEGYDNISPGTHLSGRVYVEKYVFMGTGTIIIPDIRVGNNSFLGAGCVVTKNVEPYDKIAGVPAKSIKKKTIG